MGKYTSVAVKAPGMKFVHFFINPLLHVFLSNKSGAAAPSWRNNQARFDLKTVWKNLFLVTSNVLISHLY